MNIRITSFFNQPSFVFFVLLIILSMPFYLLGAIAGLSSISPLGLPLSALMFLCPMTLALMLTYRKDGRSGMKRLLKRIFDYRRIRMKGWYIPVVLLMPAVLMLSYLIMRLINLPLPVAKISFLMIPVFFLVFSIGAIGEELGWSAYLLEPLQERLGALKASMLLGFVWAVWHIIPYHQMGHSLNWILWQCLATIGLRVIMVWIYNASGKSLFAVIVFHTMINVSEFIFPNYGSHYNPTITGIIILCVAAIVSVILSREHFSSQPTRDSDI